MYQPKVSNTQKYEDSQGSHIVTTSKLVILANGPTVDQCVPILISETEEIEEGDYFLNLIQARKDGSGVYKHDIKNYNVDKDYLYKVLALPEHFSDKHLQAIVDGKIGDGDEVLVKCNYTDCERNEKGHCIEEPNCLQWLHSQTSDVTKPDHVDCDMRPIVYLDQQNHITLFPAKQSLEDAIKEGVKNIDVYDNVGNIFAKGVRFGAEWAKKNNY